MYYLCKNRQIIFIFTKGKFIDNTEDRGLTWYWLYYGYFVGPYIRVYLEWNVYVFIDKVPLNNFPMCFTAFLTRDAKKDFQEGDLFSLLS